jgi:hypothetical protein
MLGVEKVCPAQVTKIPPELSQEAESKSRKSSGWVLNKSV